MCDNVNLVESDESLARQVGDGIKGNLVDKESLSTIDATTIKAKVEMRYAFELSQNLKSDLSEALTVDINRIKKIGLDLDSVDTMEAISYGKTTGN